MHLSFVDNHRQSPARLAQVWPVFGAGMASWAGMALSWRKYGLFLAQVRFLAGDLLHESGFYALQRRRSPPFFPTCAKRHRTCARIPTHLRHDTVTPAPRIGLLRSPVAQVPTLFPHLHQKGTAPAPEFQHTCAMTPLHLRHESGFYALQWRRSPPFFPTCTKKAPHLRQNSNTPAP